MPRPQILAFCLNRGPLVGPWSSAQLAAILCQPLYPKTHQGACTRLGAVYGLGTNVGVSVMSCCYHYLGRMSCATCMPHAPLPRHLGRFLARTTWRVRGGLQRQQCAQPRARAVFPTDAKKDEDHLSGRLRDHAGESHALLKRWLAKTGKEHGGWRTSRCPDGL